MKVYLVTYESYIEDYGSYPHLLGIFTSEDKAKDAKESYYEQIKEYYNSKASDGEKENVLYQVIVDEPDIYDHKSYEPQIQEAELDEIQGIIFKGYYAFPTCINGKTEISLGGYAE